MHGKPSTVVHRNVGVFEGLPERFQSGPLPLAVRAQGDLAGVPGSDGRIRRRRHHGNPASRIADRSGAVSSRVDPDPGRQLRASIDRKCGGASAGGQAGSFTVGTNAAADRATNIAIACAGSCADVASRPVRDCFPQFFGRRRCAEPLHPAPATARRAGTETTGAPKGSGCHPARSIRPLGCEEKDKRTRAAASG